MLQEILLEQIHHIQIISEGSCDTEVWSNNAENSALPSQELNIFKKNTFILNHNLTEYDGFFVCAVF